RPALGPRLPLRRHQLVASDHDWYDFGYRRVTGTARDDVWVSLSQDAKLLHYAPPPPSLAIKMYAGVTITGQTGATYQIQYTTDLSSPTNWVALTNLTLSSSPYLFFDATSAGRPASFYRALLVP